MSDSHRRWLLVGASGLAAAGVVLAILLLAGGASRGELVAVAGTAGLLAALAAHLGGRLHPVPVPAAPMAPPGTHSSTATHGLMPTLEAMLRFEEELALAQEYGRPLCLALAGIDVTPGLDLDDAMEGLRQITDGAVRRQDLITDRDRTSLLVMAPETSSAMGWVMADRILKRSAAAGVGTVRLVLVSAEGRDSLRGLLDELDSGLEICRATDLLFADPTRLLAARS